MIDDFVLSVKGTDITIISQEIFQHDPVRRIENLKVKLFLLFYTKDKLTKTKLLNGRVCIH